PRATTTLVPSVGSDKKAPAAGAPTGQREQPAPQREQRDRGAQQSAVPVSVLTLQQGPVASTVKYAGNLQSNYSVQVTPRATGRIEQLTVDVGSAVKTGDLLAVLDRSQLQANVLQA